LASRVNKEEHEDVTLSQISKERGNTPVQAQAPVFKTFQTPSLILAHLVPAILLLASILVAAALFLILLPQSAIDSLAHRIQSHYGRLEPEKIALLYLADRLQDNQFQIRGVIRNIAADPIEQLDAVIRLYAFDGTLSETVVVRLNKEIIEPGEIAQFALIYPHYKQQFNSYSVEFKLRQGSVLPYKDMRTRQAAPG